MTIWVVSNYCWSLSEQSLLDYIMIIEGGQLYTPLFSTRNAKYEMKKGECSLKNPKWKIHNVKSKLINEESEMSDPNCSKENPKRQNRNAKSYMPNSKLAMKNRKCRIQKEFKMPYPKRNFYNSKHLRNCHSFQCICNRDC